MIFKRDIYARAAKGREQKCKESQKTDCKIIQKTDCDYSEASDSTVWEGCDTTLEQQSILKQEGVESQVEMALFHVNENVAFM